MTPQGLLAVIGATAIGFAIAIGSAVGLASSTTTTTAQTIASEQRAPTVAYATPGMDLGKLLQTGAPQQAVAPERDCVVVL